MRKDFSIVFMPTYSCNSRCIHCFEEITPLRINDESWRDYFIAMKDFTVQKKLSRLLLYWQGGEVMDLGHGEIRKGLERCENVFEGSGIEIEHHLQTNLLLYDSNWTDLIVKYFGGNISSSLDYPNLYRKTNALGFDEYPKAWLEKKVQAENDGLIVNLVTLPNPETLERGAAAFYDYFRDIVGVRNLQINFPFTGVDGKNPAPLNLDKFSKFMHDLYVIWVDSGRYLNLNPFFALENRIFDKSGKLPCCWSYNCADFLFAVGPDGEVGQCDCWVSTHKDFSFGRLGEDGITEILESRNRDLFLDRPSRMIQDPECGQCDFWMICYGGCPIRAYTYSGEIYSRDYYCEVYKGIFSTVLESNNKERLNGKKS
jgi:radical SAM protein with 4Fe4S-binding SPASM domain